MIPQGLVLEVIDEHSLPSPFDRRARGLVGRVNAVAWQDTLIERGVGIAAAAQRIWCHRMVGRKRWGGAFALAAKLIGRM